LTHIPLKVWLISSNVAEESVLYKKLFRKLEEKLHVKVELRLLTWNRAYDTIIDAFKNNTGPDVFSLHGYTRLITSDILRRFPVHLI